MNCPNCGTANDNDAAFCYSCGFNLSEDVQSNQNDATQPKPAQNNAVNNQVDNQQPQVNISNTPNQQQMYTGTQQVYEVSGSNQTLRLVAFILNLITTIICGIVLLPLAWMIPMTVRSWGIYKGRKANTVAFGICDLLFVNLISGILLLCSRHDSK